MDAMRMRGRASPGRVPLAEVSALRSRRALRARRVVPPVQFSFITSQRRSVAGVVAEVWMMHGSLFGSRL